ncbi:uncharacterized protein LOC135214715 [Macrobrachium nipponense]|uniref:uncharacterized protein LOC135214715 n=1 Tax=Macrobrachium nipponense TaxID=159736 RepID=UPI0030C7EC91
MGSSSSSSSFTPPFSSSSSPSPPPTPLPLLPLLPSSSSSSSMRQGSSSSNQSKYSTSSSSLSMLTSSSSSSSSKLCHSKNSVDFPSLGKSPYVTCTGTVGSTIYSTTSSSNPSILSYRLTPSSSSYPYPNPLPKVSLPFHHSIKFGPNGLLNAAELNESGSLSPSCLHARLNFNL